MDTVKQFLLAGDANAAKHGSRQLTEYGLDDVEPRAVFGRECEFETLRVKGAVRWGFLEDVCRMVVQQQANPGLRRILGIEFFQQGDKVHAGVMIADDLRNGVIMQVQTCQ